MHTTTVTRTDHQIRDAVQQEMDWTSDVDADGIGVAVEDGVVSLSGEVGSYSERLAATRAALRVRGVGAVVDDLQIHPNSSCSASEHDIGQEVERALQWNVSVPDSIKAIVKERHVTLTGEAKWDFQRNAAKRAVQHLRGVSWVSDEVTLTARPTAADAEQRIKNAFERNAQIDGDKIEASIAGNTVTLTGIVRSWAEKHQAGLSAWSSPHVNHVNNNIVVRID